MNFRDRHASKPNKQFFSKQVVIQLLQLKTPATFFYIFYIFNHKQNMKQDGQLSLGWSYCWRSYTPGQYNFETVSNRLILNLL